MEKVISIERIEHEARAAAQRYSDVNAACPYPFFSDAGHAFMAVFKQERQRIESQSSNLTGEPS